MSLLPPEPETAGQDAAYRVLARKYRPADFDGLIGQEAMVRTLANAIRENRIAHAFLLTGVRGVGKTTTARIIAKALNCTGPDGAGGPTVNPCGQCEACVAIAESRHVDVLEMDAASRTGVNDIRELLDGVRYAPASARFKIYIIDEVHMLSTAAFNALLKTLEEPPPHVKFVFATTEVRRLPVTVLSRCQRFDLRRVDIETLVAHLGRICEAEGVSPQSDALALIAQAAEGSVRDGLSLLDQAIVHGDGKVASAEVRAMLGLADRTLSFDLLEAVLGGEPGQALGLLRELYAAGADPAVAIGDLLDITHWLTRLKVLPDLANDGTIAELERTRGTELAGKLPMPVLARSWQMLLKGLDEVRRAPAALAAAEMVLVRLAYAANLPPPADILKQLGDGTATPAAPASAARQPAPAPAPRAGAPAPPRRTETPPPPVAEEPPPPEPDDYGDGPEPEAAPEAAPGPVPMPRDLRGVVALADLRREGLLASAIKHDIQIVRYEPGRITFRPTDTAAPDLANRLGRFLQEQTGQPWAVVVDMTAEAEPTLAEIDAAAKLAEQAELEAHPLVRAALETFPEATFGGVRDLASDDDSEDDAAADASRQTGEQGR
ncbi:MAG: DNA polymerase III subunit gamma/tau [Alphaproteobacteria bacterium]